MQKKYTRLSLQFPAEEYMYLKIACLKKGISIKDFVTQSVLKTMEEYEDELDLAALEEARTKGYESYIPWAEMKKKLGWDKRK